MDENEVISEGRALTTVLASVEGEATRDAAIRCTEDYRTRFTRANTAEGAAIDVSLNLICGKPLQEEVSYSSTATTQEDFIFETLVELWIKWATKNTTAYDRMTLSSLDFSIKGSRLHLMVLQKWAEALTMLISGDSVEAQRKYRHATRLAGEYGTPSNPTIQWTYAAMVFTR